MSNVDPAQERRTPMLIKKITDKETDSFVFLHGEKTASYDKIPVAGQKIMDGLNRYIQKPEVAVIGPAVWSYEPVKGKLKLRSGFPVKKGTRGQSPVCGEDRAGVEVRVGRVQGIDGTHNRGLGGFFCSNREKGTELRRRSQGDLPQVGRVRFSGQYNRTANPCEEMTKHSVII